MKVALHSLHEGDMFRHSSSEGVHTLTHLFTFTGDLLDMAKSRENETGRIVEWNPYAVVERVAKAPLLSLQVDGLEITIRRRNS
jgi:hypothetical protein